MSADERPMTKTEAQAFIRRAREGLRWMEQTLRDGDAANLNEACIEVVGAVAAIQDTIDEDYGRGIRGVA